MTEEKLYQAYVHIEFISSEKHYDNLNDLMKMDSQLKKYIVQKIVN